MKEEKTSKEQQSRGMNLEGESVEKELNMKGVHSELSSLSQKNEYIFNYLVRGKLTKKR